VVSLKQLKAEASSQKASSQKQIAKEESLKKPMAEDDSLKKPMAEDPLAAAAGVHRKVQCSRRTVWLQQLHLIAVQAPTWQARPPPTCAILGRSS